MFAFSIRIKDDSLNIDKGYFTGNLKKAQKAIQAFVDKNIFTYESMRDYGTLTINGIDHDITPYGVDVFMMLQFCNIDIKNLDTISQDTLTPPASRNSIHTIDIHQNNPIDSQYLNGISMQVLGGFLSLLGIAAVSIAFAALNLATFGTSGVVVGVLGLISLGAGVGLFAVGRRRSNNEIELSPEQNVPISCSH